MSNKINVFTNCCTLVKKHEHFSSSKRKKKQQLECCHFYFTRQQFEGVVSTHDVRIAICVPGHGMAKKRRTVHGCVNSYEKCVFICDISLL